MPFCHLQFSAPRPPIRRYERAKVPAGTFGAYLRERRWSLKLEQADVAAIVGVTIDTYRNWEMNRRAPASRHKAKLTEWLAGQRR